MTRGIKNQLIIIVLRKKSFFNFSYSLTTAFITLLEYLSSIPTP